MIAEKNISIKKVRRILEQVTDPEIPVLSVLDLGIVRDILITPSFQVDIGMAQGDQVEIVITPTYSGCPAMNVIAMNIRLALLQYGFSNIKITEQLSPAWTTDWITREGKDKLKSYGIAPPQARSDGPQSDRAGLQPSVQSDGGPSDRIECPQCRSKNTKLLSQFGSTACKALYQCNDCKEPFDYFKCH